MPNNIIEIPAGEPGIYSSPDVIKAETKPAVLEKPVFEDARGRIERHEMNGVKVNLLSTKKGFMRSGDLHKNRQFDILLSGKVELWTYQNGQTIKRVIGPNTYIVINPHVPHLFNFLEDTVMMEWWDGPFEAWFYKPYRDIIDAQFKKMTSQ
ncbi:MAG: hypothetical protein QXT19_02820 [Candidatus Woesearchaeota archaeon]